MCLALYVAGQDFQLQLQHIKHYGFSPWFPLHFPVSNLSPHLQHLWYSTAAPKVMVRSGVPFEEMKSVCDYELFIWHSEILLNEECVTNKMNYYYLLLLILTAVSTVYYSYTVCPLGSTWHSIWFMLMDIGKALHIHVKSSITIEKHSCMPHHITEMNVYTDLNNIMDAMI